MLEVGKHLALARPGDCQRMQNPFPLDLAVAGKRPGEKCSIDQQPHPVSLSQQSIRDRCRGLDRMLEQGMTTSELVRPQAAVEDDANIGHALLLEFIGVELVKLTCAGAPVDG